MAIKKQQCCLSPSLAMQSPLPSAMAAVLILQSAVSSFQQETNSCWFFFFFSLFFSWSDYALACWALLHCLLNNSDISVYLFSITGFAFSIWVVSVNLYLSPSGKIHLFLLLYLKPQQCVLDEQLTQAHLRLLLVLLLPWAFLPLQGNHGTSLRSYHASHGSDRSCPGLGNLVESVLK